MFLLNDNRTTRNGMIFRCIKEAVDSESSYQIKRVHSSVKIRYEKVNNWITEGNFILIGDFEMVDTLSWNYLKSISTHLYVFN